MARRPDEWTPKEIDFLRWNYGKLGAVECSRQLGRSVQSLRVKAWKLGFKGKDPGIRWTPQMEKMVRDFYPTMFSKDLAKWIGVSHRSLIRKARELGVAKVEGFLEKRRADINRRTGAKSANATSFRKGNQIGKEFRFEKGHQMTAEEKEKHHASMKRYWERRKKLESLGLEWRTTAVKR